MRTTAQIVSAVRLLLCVHVQGTSRCHLAWAGGSCLKTWRRWSLPNSLSSNWHVSPRPAPHSEQRPTGNCWMTRRRDASSALPVLAVSGSHASSLWRSASAKGKPWTLFCLAAPKTIPAGSVTMEASMLTRHQPVCLPPRPCMAHNVLYRPTRTANRA
jgi:hypothetical protein